MTLTSKSRIDGKCSYGDPDFTVGYSVVVMPTPVIPSTFNPVSGHLSPDTSIQFAITSLGIYCALISA
jgi:hypothetical protein